MTADSADSSTAFESMASGDVASFEEAFAVFHDLAAQAPAEIDVEWTRLDGAFVSLEQRLDAAGLSVTQLDELVSTGTIPDGVNVAELQKLTDEMQQLGSAEFAEAANAIERYGVDTCDVVLSS